MEDLFFKIGTRIEQNVQENQRKTGKSTIDWESHSPKTYEELFELALDSDLSSLGSYSTSLDTMSNLENDLKGETYSEDSISEMCRHFEKKMNGENRKKKKKTYIVL